MRALTQKPKAIQHAASAKAWAKLNHGREAGANTREQDVMAHQAVQQSFHARSEEEANLASIKSPQFTYDFSRISVNPKASATELSLVSRKEISGITNRIPPYAADLVSKAECNVGQPLPSALRPQLERLLGANLGKVRIHTGAASEKAATAISAKAYTLGQNIHFGAGRFNPVSREGQRLIAHETAHTIQQGGDGLISKAELKVSQPDDRLEIEAERFSQAFVGDQSIVKHMLPVSSGVTRHTIYREVTDEQRAALEAILDPIEIAQTSISASHTTARRHYEGARTALQGAEANFATLRTNYEQGLNSHVVLLQKAVAEDTLRHDQFEAVFSFLAMPFGVPGMSGTMNHLGYAITALGQLLAGPEVTPPGSQATPAAGGGVGGAALTSASLNSVFTNGNIVSVLEQVEAGRTLIALARQVIELGGYAQQIAASGDRLTTLYINVNRHLRSAPNATGTPSDVVAQVLRLQDGQLDAKVAGVEAALTSTETLLQQLEQTEQTFGQAATKYNPTEMEKRVWIDWLAHLSTEGCHTRACALGPNPQHRTADVVDINAIENRLVELGVVGADSILGVNFGLVTSDSDIDNAVIAARGNAFQGRIGTIVEHGDLFNTWRKVEIDGVEMDIATGANNNAPEPGTRVRVTGQRFIPAGLTSGVRVELFVTPVAGG